jgi:M-phase inducer tyrosine phosphatase
MPTGRPRLGSVHDAFQSARNLGSPSGPKKVGQIPGGRPRKLFRRTLSMYEHPGDVMRSEKRNSDVGSLESVMDVDETYELKLPNFVPDDKPDSLPRIHQDTMISVLNGDYNHLFAKTMVIDCRFEYEYSGGHVDGATNFNDKEQLAKQLFDPTPSGTSTTLIILHCEYSAHRAPLMAKYIRQQDRAVNAAKYPQLTYPEVYILDGGYSAFFKNHRSRCYPQSYVEMDSQGNELACERGLNKIRIGQRAKLGRSQTYAFGQKMQIKSQDLRSTGILEEHSSPCRGIGESVTRPAPPFGSDLHFLPSTQPGPLSNGWGQMEELSSKMTMTKRTVSY